MYVAQKVDGNGQNICKQFLQHHISTLSHDHGTQTLFFVSVLYECKLTYKQKAGKFKRDFFMNKNNAELVLDVYFWVHLFSFFGKAHSHLHTV